jgi:hypothetical protein
VLTVISIKQAKKCRSMSDYQPRWNASHLPSCNLEIGKSLRLVLLFHKVQDLHPLLFD